MEKTRSAARGLGCLCPRVDRIASSPLLRAVQTADIAREELESKREVEIWPELALLAQHEADLMPLRARIVEAAKTCGCLLLVGHEPGCGYLLSLLLCGQENMTEFNWKKAGVASAQVNAQGHLGSLDWFASPKMLRALATQTSGP